MCREMGVKETLQHEMISQFNNSVGHQELNALKWFAVFSKGHLDNFIEDKLSQLNVSSEVFAKFEYVKKK